MNQKEKRAFVRALVKEGMTAEDAEAILEHADTIQRLAVVYCNRGHTKREEAEDAAAEDAVRAICARASEGKPRVKHQHERNVERAAFVAVFQGDPRGACTKIRVPSGRYDDWGQTGLCVPTRRY